MSIYVDEVGKSLRAKYLLRYSKRFDEIWADVPTGETRYAKLRDIVSAHSDAARNPVSLLGYYDCVSTPRDIDTLAPNHHQICCVCGGKNGSGSWSDYMEVLTDVVKALEAEYGRIWAFDMANCSDVHCFYFGFHDPLSDFAQSWNSVPAGFDTKFLCDCGQYRGLSAFKAACEWTLGSDGKVRAGFVYNDSSDAGLCSDRVSTGGDVFFRNIGSVGNSMSDDDNGRRYSYLAKARNVDESKCRDCGEAGSIEEFSIRRAAEGGLAPGDWFTLTRHVAVNGEKRAECIYPLWDGEKWIDYETERPVQA